MDSVQLFSFHYVALIFQLILFALPSHFRFPIWILLIEFFFSPRSFVGAG